MNARDTVRARILADGTIVEVLPDGSTRPLESRTDWAALDAMTEEEIEANAVSDPDNPPMTRAELAAMQRVPNPREIRRRLHLSQEQFATQFQVPLGTLRDWEQGRCLPDSTARTLLRVIEASPDVVRAALRS